MSIDEVGTAMVLCIRTCRGCSETSAPTTMLLFSGASEDKCRCAKAFRAIVGSVAAQTPSAPGVGAPQAAGDQHRKLLLIWVMTFVPTR